MTEPRQALEEAGATCHLITPNGDDIESWDEDNWGKTFKADRALEDAHADEYHALLLPGGVLNPDTLRENDTAIQFIRQFFSDGKPVGAICHGPQLLIEAEVLQGRTVTSYSSIKTDVKNAGAIWVDREVVTDEGLVTSRNPDDLPAFCEKLVEEVAEGVHEEQSV